MCEIVNICLLQEFNQYCEMVDRARNVDVEGSMAQKKWSTDEFQHVLAVYTQQVHIFVN